MDKRYLLGTIYQTAPFLIWLMLFLSSCASAPIQKKWSDAYDPEQWRNQYKVCKHLINTELWTKCMGEFNKNE